MQRGKAGDFSIPGYPYVNRERVHLIETFKKHSRVIRIILKFTAVSIYNFIYT